MGSRNIIFFKFVKLWNYIFSNKKNSKPITIVLKDKVLNNDAKLKYQEKYINKIISKTNNNIKCKNYMGYICFDHI